MDTKYIKKIEELKKVGDYIDRLYQIECDMDNDVNNNKLDKKVHNILESCMDKINDIYINSVPLEVRLNAINDEGGELDTRLINGTHESEVI